jgi:hypothetical protein
MTLTQAVFASAACCSLATDPNINGALRVNNSGWRLQQYGGQFSDLDTLRLALERGLPANHRTMQGAAESGLLDKVRWLHEVQETLLPTNIGEWAAKGGTLSCSLGSLSKAASSTCTHALRQQRLVISPYYATCESKIASGTPASQLQQQSTTICR